MMSKVKAAWAALAIASVAFSATASAAQPPAKKATKAAKAPARAAPARPAGPPLTATGIEVMNWVVRSGDNGDLPFMVIDKVAAVVALFDAAGKPLGTSAALFGITPGDESSPGVGDRELSDIAPEERTTPAGRFVSKFGPAAGHRRVLWVDYSTSISLHPVITTNKKERRVERLRSASSDDNRITFGCINVPSRFYTSVVVPNFKKDIGVVYILPEIKSLTEAFPAYQPQVVSR